MSQLVVHPHYWTAYALLQRLVVEHGGDVDWSNGRLSIAILQAPINDTERAMLDSLDAPTPTYPVGGSETNAN